MDEDHSKGESGASETFPKQCSALRKGEHVVIKNHPCKIVDMSTSKTGKHGHAKVHMVALDIFTGKKYEDICPSTHNMTCPNVKRVELQVLDIDEDGFFSLLADDGNTRDDLQLNDAIEQAEKKEMIKRAKDCVDGEGECHATVLKAMDHEWIIDIKQKQVKK